MPPTTFLRQLIHVPSYRRGRRGYMVVGFTTTHAISAYHHLRCEFESYSWRGVLDTALCDKVCQWLVAGWGFSPGTPWPPRRNWNIVESGVKHNNPITPFSPKMGHKSKPDVICIGLKLVSISDEIDNEKYTLSKPCKLYLVNLKKN